MTSTSGKEPVALLLGNYRPSLTLARDLQRKGYRVVVSSHGCERGCQYSRAVSDIWDHAPLEATPDRFAQELQMFHKDNPNLAVIFPVAEEYVRLIAEHENSFEGLPPIATVDAATVRKCLDKPYMMQLSHSCDVPTAPFSTSSNTEQFYSAMETVGFPLIVRPSDSTKRIDGAKALFLNSAAEAEQAFKDFSLGYQDLLLQQKFEGVRHNVYFAAHDGVVKRCLHAVIDRTDSPDGTGLAVEGRTLPAGHPLVDQTCSLVRALGYTGIGCAQFLFDEVTEQSSFLEINPRIAGNHALPEFAGLELGTFMLDLALGRKPGAGSEQGRAGIRYCWTSGDLMGAKVSYLRGEVSLRETVTWIIRALSVGFRSDVHMVFSVSDPAPALHALWDVVPRLARWKRPVISPRQNTITNHTSGKSL
ncbi:hypothetical protein [Hoeflea prorocentri]|uniref:ATP-grasp domain-containing protein n=1 Tax=Hoeflea prorocentri TaxID=1922333 RepID=A0A9X3UGV4_9HYPH|nr:hypothetical protein [Hoeflea prorocentri]MCY6380426.1 hypothetical protein [Hoeflea prorocentri]MDA5398226.1 hypothetical protein [Hoeflea prorocentri]